MFTNKDICVTKAVKKLKIGNKEGYRVCRDRKTINQLKEITEVINYQLVVNGKGSKDCSFYLLTMFSIRNGL